MKQQEIGKQVLCPSCGQPMRLRNGKFGEFWGCSQFPRCKTVVKKAKNGQPAKKSVLVRPTEFRKKLVPNRYQLAIFNEIQNGSGNIITEACAGSGKTTTNEYASFLLPRDKRCAYIVFNTHIKEEALTRMPPWVEVMTTHSLGLQAITAYTSKKPEIVEDKVERILKDLLVLGGTFEFEKGLVSLAANLVSKAKNTLIELDEEGAAFLCDRYAIETNGNFFRIWQLAREALLVNNRNLSVVDFDDMIYLPVKLNMVVRQFDWILGDEVQDFNVAQIELLKKALTPNGRILAVGDSNQSMYGFRGADIEAMQKVKNGFNALSLPLSITYRCPRSHVELVNKLFPDIPFEAAPNAKEGEIISISEDRMLGMVSEGDMILCRVNAPLVKPCFELIRRGIKATIAGRDIGKGLVNFIERMNAKDLPNLLRKLREHEEKEVNKLLAENKGNQAAVLQDKVDTILALSSGCRTVKDVIIKIEEVFSDDRKGIVFSTVHKAKGLEAERVFILRPDLLPHPMAKQAWEKLQEENIKYVAMTRSLNVLAFVGEIPVDDMYAVSEEEEIR